MKNWRICIWLLIVTFCFSLNLSAQSKRSELERALGLIEGRQYQKAFPIIKGLYDRPGDLSDQERFKVSHQLGTMYFFGLGTEWNFRRAYDILSSVADQGYVPAQILLGNVILGNHGGGEFEWYNEYLDYLEEMEWDETKNRVASAKHWYQKAIDSGSSEGLFLMGFLLESYEKDKDGATYYYRLAHDEGYHLATFVLGDIYLDGANPAIASKFFKEVATVAPESVYCGLHSKELETICAYLLKNKDIALAEGPFQFPDFTHHTIYVLPDGFAAVIEEIGPMRARTGRLGMVKFSSDGEVVARLNTEYRNVYYDDEGEMFECEKLPTDKGFGDLIRLNTSFKEL